MQYKQIKKNLLQLFDYDKLQALPSEWGFFNENDRDIRKIGYATNITLEIIDKAKEENIDFLLTHHDSWEFVFGLKDNCDKKLIEYGITHAFFHAPLDDAEFGTSASLAQVLGMVGCKKVMPYAELTGMNLFVGSHTNTEILGVKAMAELISKGSDIELIRIKEPNY